MVPGAARVQPGVVTIPYLFKYLGTQCQAAHDSLFAFEAVVDDIGIDVVDLGRDDIAVEHFGALFAASGTMGVWSATPPPMMIFCGA